MPQTHQLWGQGGAERTPWDAATSRSPRRSLTSVDEAEQRAVRRAHQVDQAGLAVAHGVQLCSQRETRRG